MRLSLHAVICCCIFTTVLPQGKGATAETNTILKKRFKVWLQSHMKGGSSLMTADEPHLDVFGGPQQDGHTKTVSPPTNFGLNIRPKRSTGCLLITCLLHDLLDRLSQMNNQKQASAPEKKMGSYGYGRRRRRSLADATQLVFQRGTQRWSAETSQRVSSSESAHTVV